VIRLAMMKLAAVGIVMLATGCPLFSSQQRQVGLVPAPRAMSYDGQRMTKNMRVEGRANTTVGERATIADGETTNHSAYVARDVIGGGVFGMAGETEIGASFDHIRSRNATPMTAEAGALEAPTESGYTVTFSVRRSMPLDNGWAVGIAGDLGATKVPIVRDDARRVSDIAGLYRVALVPSYKSGPLTLFASLQMTNDIVVPDTIDTSDDEGEASASGTVIVPAAGASVMLGDGVKVTTQIAKPLNTTVEHGPQLELSLGYEFGSD
jgi:hypothetical protein